MRSQIQCTAADALWLQYGTKHAGPCTAVVCFCFDELLVLYFFGCPESVMKCFEQLFTASNSGRGFCDVCYRAAVGEQSFCRGVQLKLDPLLVELSEET